MIRTLNFIGVDGDFLATFEVELIQGRNFVETMTTDTTAVLINETAAAMFGWEEPLGQEITVQRGQSTGRRYVARVIGVVKDFHLRLKNPNLFRSP